MSVTAMLHPWHNKVAAMVDRSKRLEEINITKPKDQLALRIKLMQPASPGILSELDAIDAKWQPERDAIHAKWQTELDAIHAKWQTELDAIHAKWQTERDAIDAKWQTERDAIDAKWQTELDAIHAKWQPERDAIDAKWQPERDAIHAKWQTERDAIHARYCLADCPWDGETIFTYKNNEGDWCMKGEGVEVPERERIV